MSLVVAPDTSLPLFSSASSALETTARPVEKPPEKTPNKTQSIKMRLHVNTPAIKAWLLDSVDAVSKISIHVSRFANMYILYCCQNNLPLPEVDNVFYNNAMYL